MTIEERRRELFEAWDRGDRCFRLRWENGNYVYATTRREWSAFNAALDAVVIGLPGSSGWPCEFADGFNSALGECRDSIKSTGLGLKVLP